MAKGRGKKKDKKKKKKKDGAGAGEKAPDPDLHFGSGKFEFPNGDVYEGDFCAHRHGICWRQGSGLYTTKDGQVYEGEWNDDKMVEGKEMKIKFPNGAEYCGALAKNKYSGSAVYTLENKLPLFCHFVDNQPKGDLVMVDHNGIVWTGQASGHNSSFLLPENVFLSSLDYESGKGRPGRGASSAKLPVKPTNSFAALAGQPGGEKAAATPEPEDGVPVDVFDRELEKTIFVNTKRTPTRGDSGRSRWWRDYAEFKAKKDRIVVFARLMGETFLDEDDRKWYEKYLEFKSAFAERMAKRGERRLKTTDSSLLGRFLGEEFKKGCPAIRVFYPYVRQMLVESQDGEEDEEEGQDVEEIPKN